MTLTHIKKDEDVYVEELRRRLRGQMQDKLYADHHMFRRFLRARNYDLNAAENMLKNHIQWRKDYKIDTLTDTFSPQAVCTKYVPANKIGFDREGCPILYCQVGDLDVKGLLKSAKHSEIIMFVVNLIERAVDHCDEQSKKLGRLVDQITMIFNFENFSLMTATHKEALEVVGTILKIYESNYPERLKVAYVTNASFYFTLLFAVVKPFLTGNTLQKIKMFGKDGWLEEVLKTVHPGNWPTYLGGNLRDPDGNPLCKTHVTHGGLVDESYFRHTDVATFSKLPGVRKLSVNRLSKVEVRLEVLFAGSCIEWEFETKSRDIAFALLYADRGRCHQVLPKQRVSTSVASEAGLYRCERPGVYILEFDNTYSWLNQKEIYCKASVVTPQNQKLTFNG